MDLFSTFSIISFFYRVVSLQLPSTALCFLLSSSLLLPSFSFSLFLFPPSFSSSFFLFLLLLLSSPLFPFFFFRFFFFSLSSILPLHLQNARKLHSSVLNLALPNWCKLPAKVERDIFVFHDTIHI